MGPIATTMESWRHLRQVAFQLQHGGCVLEAAYLAHCFDVRDH